jgi:SAM-dependent methyltransferase
MRAVLEIRHSEDSSKGWSKDGYEAIYHRGGFGHPDGFYRWLLSLLNAQPGRIFLDISCGVGTLPRLAAQADLKAHGVDFSQVALQIAYRESPQPDWVAGDAEHLPYADATFDYVTSIGSLEHYTHPEAGARELARILKADGRACVLLPNTFGLLGNVWHALRTGRTFEDGQPIQRYAARLEWQNLLEEGGLTVERTVQCEFAGPRRLADAGWYLTHPKDLVRLVLSPLVPLNLANYFVFLCSRTPDAA